MVFGVFLIGQPYLFFSELHGQLLENCTLGFDNDLLPLLELLHVVFSGFEKKRVPYRHLVFSERHYFKSTGYFNAYTYGNGCDNDKNYILIPKLLIFR